MTADGAPLARVQAKKLSRDRARREMSRPRYDVFDLPLFGALSLPPAQASRPTSIAAAESVAVVAERQAQHILAFLRRRKTQGATLEEIARGTGLSIQTVCGRRWELENKIGAVVDSGTRRCNRTGRTAIVWVAAEFAPKKEAAHVE